MSEQNQNPTTPTAVTETKANDGGAPEVRLFTQAELDGILAERLSRAKKDAPEKEELEVYRQWKETQKTETEKQRTAMADAAQAQAAAEARAEELERQITALGKGVPPDKAPQYMKLAESYMDDKTGFSAALDIALKAFPTAAPGVGGTGANPPAAVPDKKSARPAGIQTF